MESCRVCKKESVKSVGVYAPYVEYQFEVYDCMNCGCRFVRRDALVYDSLHSNPNTSYSAQSVIASKVKQYVDRKDPEKLRRFLSKNKRQFKFVIDSIRKDARKDSSILEVGCSRGYLTAYFLMMGNNSVGIDISSTAIERAKADFGDHFKLVRDDDSLKGLGKYDVIFHIGTIGCVEDPIRLTNDLIDILKPGGTLLFNVPNLAAVQEMNAIWTNTAPPPDVVTLFKASFWEKFFSDKVDLEISYEPYDHKSNLAKHIGRKLNRPYLRQSTASINDYSKPKTRKTLAGRAAGVSFSYANYLTRFFLPRYSSEYGMYVRMKKPV
jgi:SAM-dependent methyltransferase